jgi:diguanylate cyclase (GGDEF)-like protein/PAS domain S-box-containing protein
MYSRPSTLLVVDDEEEIRDLMCRRLSRRGFGVSQAESGKSALDWLGRNRADLILLDMEMPGMTGYEVLSILRQTYTPAQLPVIVATGDRRSEDGIEAIEMGANDFVTKPIEFPVVLTRIKTQLSRRLAEEALRESEERYALAARGANDGLWEWDLVANKAYFSPRWKAMLGWDENEIEDDLDEWFRRVHPDDVDRVRGDLNAHVNNLTPLCENEYRMQHRDGNYLWMLGRGLAVRDENGKAYRIAGSQTDITRGKVADVLTGLPNRILFIDRLNRAFERTKRRKDKSFAVLFLDLDGFKLVNDSLGHFTGDQLLVGIASRIEHTLRFADTVARFGRNNTVARLGGDEFTILLEEVDSPVIATRIAERILKELEPPFIIGSHEVFTSASIGIAIYNSEYVRGEDLLRDADTAMYRAKSLGKARYEVFDSNMRASTTARLQLETELRHGLERKEFQVYYQLVVALDTFQIRGAEALVRWNHPVRGLLPPDEFIPVAEEIGLLLKLDQFVMETACRQMVLWQTRFASDPPMTINVNISARHLQQMDLVEICRDIMAKAELPSSSLTLELTESAVMPNPEAAADLMNRLKELNIKIALDDFGTGYSSLSYLHRFPLDALKIDRSFVARMTEAQDQLEIVKTIINLGHNIGLKVVAEGVETAEQIHKLRELGCDYGQGYFFSVPLSSDDATNIIAAAPRNNL